MTPDQDIDVTITVCVESELSPENEEKLENDLHEAISEAIESVLDGASYYDPDCEEEEDEEDVTDDEKEFMDALETLEKNMTRLLKWIG